MEDARGFVPREYSLSPIDLIPEDEGDETIGSEVDARCAHYAMYGRLVDKDDAKAMIVARFLESVELDAIVDDALSDPLGHDRPHIHVADQLRLGQALVNITKDVLDEYISMLAIAGGED